MDALLAYEPSPEVRVLLLFAFLGLGLVLSLQFAQVAAEEPLRWTKLTDSSRPYWYTLYVLEAFLLVQNTYPIVLAKMHGYANGYEERILNTVWIGLLGIEVLMVLGVATKSVFKRLGAGPKQKTQ